MAIVVAGAGVALDNLIPRPACLALQVVFGGIIYVALVAAADRAAFDDALVLVRERRLGATPSSGATPSADAAHVRPAKPNVPSYIAFDDIGRLRAPWEDIAEGWPLSSPRSGRPDLHCREDECE